MFFTQKYIIIEDVYSQTNLNLEGYLRVTVTTQFVDLGMRKLMQPDTKIHVKV